MDEQVVELREWAPFSHLLSRIPAKAQKGLSTLPLNLTAVAASGDFLALGTNVGLIYCFNRRSNVLHRLKTNNTASAISSLAIISCPDLMVGGGNGDGEISIFHVTPTPRVIRFELRSGEGRIHGGCKISCLEWSSNGLKLFSGDIGGGVALTELDFDNGIGQSRPLLQERGEIVELSYLRKHLLISSTLQSLIFSLTTNQATRVGSQERKIHGRFGGLWRKRSSLAEPSTLYSVRPGCRLWLAAMNGLVQHTIKFKDVLIQGDYASIPIINPSPTQISNLAQRDFQIGSLYHWKSSYLVTTTTTNTNTSSTGGGQNNNSNKSLLLLILDPLNSRILAVCNELGGGILDVAVNEEEEEIFVLQSNRNLIRIASRPDPFPTTMPITEGEESSHRFFLRNFPQMNMQPANVKKKMIDSMSSMVAAGEFGLDAPFALLTSTLKETSRRVAAPVHQTSSSIVQGLRQVFEGEVEDGIWPLVGSMGVIPLPDRPLSSSPSTVVEAEAMNIITDSQIANESGQSQDYYLEQHQSFPATEEGISNNNKSTNMMDKFCHISHLPFDDVLVTPKTTTTTCAPPRLPSTAIIKSRRRKLTIKNKTRQKQKGGGDDDGLVMPVLSSSTYSLHSLDDEVVVNGSSSTGEGGGGIRRELKDHYDDEEGKLDNQSSKMMMMPGVNNMSQSWSVGQIPPELGDDLESKEEILARKLNWPELIPESKRSKTVSPTTIHNKRCDESTRLDDDDALKEEEDEEDEQKEGPLIVIDPNGSNNNNNNSLSSLEESLDIYTRYRNPTDDNNDDGLLFYASIYNKGEEEDSSNTVDACLSFGPPSSNTSNSNPISLTQLKPTIFEIDETTLSSSSNSEEDDGSQELLENRKEPSSESSDCFSLFQKDKNDLAPIRDMVVEPHLSDRHDHWIAFAAPGPLDSLAACDSYILVLDRKKHVYAAQLPSFSSSSSGSSLRWIQVGWSGDAVALSPCGRVLWRLMGSTLYSLMDPISTLFSPTTSSRTDPSWVKLVADATCNFTLQSHVGWLIRGDGSLHFATGLLASSLVPQFQAVPTPVPLLRIALGGGGNHQVERKLWALTVDGRLLYRRGMSEDCVCGTDWGVIQRSQLPFSTSISSLSTLQQGDSNLLFLADVEANLYFIKKEEVWKVSMGEYLRVSSSSSSSSCFSYSSSLGGNRDEGTTEKGFSLSGFRAKLRRPTEGLIGSFLSSSSSSSSLNHKGNPILGESNGGLWWSLRGSSTLHLNHSLVTGHRWESLIVSRPLRKSGCGGNWTRLMGGSIYLDHGVLWLLDNKGKLFYSNPSGGDAKSIDLPTSNPLSCVVPAPDALWILNKEGTIWSRDNISSHNPIGHGWAKIDLSSQEKLHLIHVSCGSDVAWGCDTAGRVYFRIGSLRPPATPNDMSPPWVQVEDDSISFSSSPSSSSSSYTPPPPSRGNPPIIFTKVYVGTNGSMVWGLDSKQNIYCREAVFPDFPIGTRWLLVSGLEGTSLALSEGSVWALSPKGSIFRRYGISKNNFVGDFWKRIPTNQEPREKSGLSGVVVDLTVSLCDQMWALDGTGWVGKHCSTTLQLVPPPSTTNNGPPLLLPPPINKSRTIPEDRDWELIESLDLS